MFLLVTLPNPSINHGPPPLYEILNVNVVVGLERTTSWLSQGPLLCYLVLTWERRPIWFKKNGPKREAK